MSVLSLITIINSLLVRGFTLCKWCNKLRPQQAIGWLLQGCVVVEHSSGQILLWTHFNPVVMLGPCGNLYRQSCFLFKKYLHISTALVMSFITTDIAFLLLWKGLSFLLQNYFDDISLSMSNISQISPWYFTGPIYLGHSSVLRLISLKLKAVDDFKSQSIAVYDHIFKLICHYSDLL